MTSLDHQGCRHQLRRRLSAPSILILADEPSCRRSADRESMTLFNRERATPSTRSYCSVVTLSCNRELVPGRTAVLASRRRYRTSLYVDEDAGRVHRYYLFTHVDEMAGTAVVAGLPASFDARAKLSRSFVYHDQAQNVDHRDSMLEPASTQGKACQAKASVVK